MSKKPTVLMILDGYGLNDKKEGNAVYLAKTPEMCIRDRYFGVFLSFYPW